MEAWSNRGNTLNAMKRYDEALASFERVLALKPDYVDTWSNHGATLNELKRYDEALAVLSEHWHSNPNTSMLGLIKVLLFMI